MTCTDEDLTRVKGYLKKGYINQVTFEDVEGLVTRLEAAEDLILNHTVTPIAYDNKYKAWLKAAGK